MTHIIELLAEKDENESRNKGGDNKNIEKRREVDLSHPAGNISPEIEANSDAGKPDTGKESAVAVGAEMSYKGETDRGKKKFGKGHQAKGGD